MLAYRQRHAREKLFFCNDLLDQLATEATEATLQGTEYFEVLRRCLKRLPQRSREVLWQRYDNPGSVNTMAESMGRSPAAVSQLLYRIRAVLLKCMNVDLRREQS